MQDDEAFESNLASLSDLEVHTTLPTISVSNESENQLLCDLTCQTILTKSPIVTQNDNITLTLRLQQLHVLFYHQLRKTTTTTIALHFSNIINHLHIFTQASVILYLYYRCLQIISYTTTIL